jgi:hypothetical protein
MTDTAKLNTLQGHFTHQEFHINSLVIELDDSLFVAYLKTLFVSQAKYRRMVGQDVQELQRIWNEELEACL